MNILKYKTLLILIFVTTALPVPAFSYYLEFHSDTYLHLYQEDQSTGPNSDYAPLYEYISLDVREVGRPELSFHLYGWGRADLRDKRSGDTSNGHLSSAQVRYLSNSGESQVRAGRMLLAEGTAFETLDGVLVRKSLGITGFSVFGGKPDTDDTSGNERGDTLAGARVYIINPGKMEIGLNYLNEDGDFGGEEREETGADFWFEPKSSLQITGHARYNNTTSGLASDDISFMFALSSVFNVTLASEGYIYENLFQAVTNPAFYSSAINLADEVRITKGEFSWDASGRLTVRGILKNIDHKEADPGNTRRTEFGLDMDTSKVLDRIGLRLASQTGDIPENEYTEMRAFCMATKKSMRWSLDALAQIYGERIGGEDQTTQLVGSAGWKMSDKLDLSGDIRFTQSPVYDEDLAVVLRARYDFGAESGAN